MTMQPEWIFKPGDLALIMADQTKARIMLQLHKGPGSDEYLVHTESGDRVIRQGELEAVE